MNLRNLIIGCFFIFSISYANATLVSLNFSNTKIETILSALAKFSHFNIVISNQVTGKMSLHVENQPWSQILQTILTSQGLTKKQYGKTIYVAPASELLQKNEESYPVSQLFPLKYSKAIVMEKLLKPLLMKGESISADERTNALLLQARPLTSTRLAKIIRELDVPVKQVMISARIVNVDSNYERALGVRFNSSSPQSMQVRDNNFSVDLPVVATNAASLNIALFKLGQDTLLNLELSALEAEGHADIISRPELIAANQQVAEIQAGQEVPYQEKTKNDSTSVVFKKAVLGLKVIPQIVSNNRVILHLTVNQDKPSAKEVLGVPEIDTRRISTNVSLKNKQTVVLGGIYERVKNDQVQRVPFISSLPLVGNLFRYRKMVKNRRELLIFVTPKIMQ